MALSDRDATGIAHYTTRQQGLREGVPPLNSIAIADLLRFHVTTSRGRIEDERIIVDSINTSAAGYLDNPFNDEDRRIAYNVSIHQIALQRLRS